MSIFNAPRLSSLRQLWLMVCVWSIGLTLVPRPSFGQLTSLAPAEERRSVPEPAQPQPWKLKEPVSLLPGVRLVPPNGALEIAGVKLVGVTAENGTKVLVSLGVIGLLFLLGAVLRWLTRRLVPPSKPRVEFWVKQGIQLLLAILLLTLLASIWFDDPGRLTTALGLITAGLAFALQRVVTALAGYFVILRGKTFNVGDRITMGGVRGDVIALRFLQTTIMEMGQPPSIASQAEPAMWVRSRQYTGRVVTVTNAKIFDEPVFNYTRDFPYLFEEVSLPIPYRADRERVERVLLRAAEKYSVEATELGAEALREMQRRYFLESVDVRPKTYYRITDSWLEVTVRFVVRDRGIRETKDAIAREILKGLDEVDVTLASASFEIAAVPPIKVEVEPPSFHGAGPFSAAGNDG